MKLSFLVAPLPRRKEKLIDKIKRVEKLFTLICFAKCTLVKTEPFPVTENKLIGFLLVSGNRAKKKVI